MAGEPIVQTKIAFDPRQAEKAYQDALAFVRRNPIKVSIQADGRSIKDLNNGLGKLAGSADEFTKSLEAANSRVLAFGASVGIIAAIQAGFSSLVKSTIEVEKAFKQIEVVGDQFARTQAQLQNFGRGIFDVARQTGQSFETTAKAALEFARQGLSAAETLERTRDALVLTRISGLDATASVEGLTAAFNSFKKEGITTAEILNKLIAVDNKFAVSSADLIEAIRRSGSFAQEAGLQFDELIATVTVLQETTARGGSVIGNSLKTILERVRRPESLQQLKGLNVEIEDLRGNVLPAIQILDNFSRAVENLSPAQRSGALRQIAGTLQINQLSALIDVLENTEDASNQYTKALQTSRNASNEAEIANRKLNESLGVSIDNFLTTATKFGAAFGSSAFTAPFKKITDAATFALDGLADVFSESGGNFAQALAKTFGEVLTGPGASVALGAAIVFATRFARFAVDSFKSFFKINEAAQQQNAIQASILNVMRSRGDIEAQLIALGNNEVAQARLLKQIYEDIAVTEARRATISKNVAANLAGSFVIGSSGLPSPKGKRAAGGFVPGLVEAEYNDIQRGVGGAPKGSNVVLLKNFPFGGGKKGTMVANSSEAIMPMGNKGAAVLNKKMLGSMGYADRAAEGSIPNLSLAGAIVASRSGKFAPVKKIEAKIEELSRSLTEQSKGGLEFANTIRAALKEFELTSESIKSITKASTEFSKALKLQGVAAKEAYELALRENAQKRKQMALEQARISEIKKQASLATDPLSKAAILAQTGMTPVSARLPNPFNPKPGEPLSLARRDSAPVFGRLNSPTLTNAFPKSTDALSKAVELGREKRLQELARSPRGLSNAPSLVSSAEKSSKTLDNFTEEVEASKKSIKDFGFDLAISYGIIYTATSFLGNTIGTFNEKLGESIKELGNVAFALVAIAKLGKDYGGVNLGSIPTGKGNFSKGVGFGRTVGPPTADVAAALATSRTARIGATVGTAVSGITAFGKGIVAALPVIGQVVAGLFALDGVLKLFNINTFDFLVDTFSGLSKAGREARDSLKDFALKTGSERLTGDRATQDLNQIRAKEQLAINAKALGISTTNKSELDTAAEVLVKNLQKSLSSVRTGRQITKTVIDEGIIGSESVITKDIQKDGTFADLDANLQQVIADRVARIYVLNEKQLRELAVRNNLDTSLKGENLQMAVVQDAASKFISQSNVEGITQFDESNTLAITKFFTTYINGLDEVKKRQRNGLFDRTQIADIGVSKQQISSALELGRIQADFASEQERILQLQLRTAETSDVEKANIQVRLNQLEFERKLRSEIFDSAAKTIEELSKSPSFEGGEVLLSDLNKAVSAIKKLPNLTPEETVKRVNQVFEILGQTNELSREQLNLLKSSYQSLDPITVERQRQLDITNEQIKAEAAVSQRIQQRKALLDAEFNVRSSRLDVSRAGIQSQISAIGAARGNPSLGIGGQESLQRKENGLQSQSLLSDLQKAQLEAAKSLQDLQEQKSGLAPGVFEKQTETIKNNLDATTQGIYAQISALEEQSAQIGATKSALTSFNDSILQFNRGLGELEGSNLFSILQSGDASSLFSALSEGIEIDKIKQFNKVGEDAVKSLAQGTALRQKDFDLQTAQSKVQKLQIEQEISLLKEIFAINNSNLSLEEKSAAIIAAQNKNLKDQRSLRFGVRSAVAQIQDETQNFSATFGETATLGFRDAISESLKAAANNTGDLKNALLDVALSFANKLRDAAFDNLANILTSNLFGGGAGGGGSSTGNILSSLLGAFTGAQKYASGGKVTGGTGAKDDVPTLLMGGEYVINKKSVQKYGPQFFAALNNGSIQGMATGGQFIPGTNGQKAIRGKNLLSFAAQQGTSGSRDVISDLGGGAAMVGLEPESARLTNFGRQLDTPMNQAVRQTREQALELYFQGQVSQKEFEERQDAARKAEKEKYKQLLISLGLAAVGSYAGTLASGVGSGIAANGQGMGTANQPYNARYVSELPQSLQTSSTLPVRSYSSASNLSPGTTRALSNLPFQGVNSPSYSNPLLPRYRNSGGAVGGSGYGDNVPALLTGGEFVMNRKAAKNIGLAGLNAANSGQSIGTSEEKSEELNEKLISALNDLGEKMSGQGSVTVQINSGEGKTTQSSVSGDGSEDKKKLAKMIGDMIVAKLQEEQRLGGVLRR